MAKIRSGANASIKIDRAAKAEIDHTLTGAKDKVAEAVVKAFKKELGSADPAKMQKVSEALGKKLSALQDNGSQGYWAHPTTDQKLRDLHMDSRSVVAYTHRWDKNIYVNVGHGWNHSALTWAVEHESGHSAVGFFDWSYVSQHIWRNNAMSYPQRMTNADSQTALAHDIAGEH